MGEKEVRNKKLILRDYVCGFPKESDMYVTSDATVNLKVPEDSKGVLLKNLFLAADPHLRPLMKKADNASVLQSFTPGSVSLCVCIYIFLQLSFSSVWFPRKL